MPATINTRRHLPSLKITTSTTESSNPTRRSRSTDVSEDYAVVAEDAKLLNESCLGASAHSSSTSTSFEMQYVRPLIYRIIITILLVIIFALSMSLVYLMFRDTCVEKDEHRTKTDDLANKAVVIASYREQNITWIDSLPSDWQVYRYIVDDPHSSPLTVPRNQGREAMPYLTFIIDNYHSLPAYTVFVHGHGRAWHQPEPLPMKIAALNLNALDKEGYINLRCGTAPGCQKQWYMNMRHTPAGDNRPAAKLLPQFWHMLFQSDSGTQNKISPPPEELGVACCAQFAVTRQVIRNKSLNFWKKMRRPLERDLDEFPEELGSGLDSYTMGLLYEKLWHVVFGKPAVHCPDEDYCRKVYFSDAITCDRYTTTVEEAEASHWEEIECTSTFS